MAKAPKKKPAGKSKRPLKRVKAPALFEGALPDAIPAIDRQCEKLMEAQAEISKAREHKDEVHTKLLDMMHSENIKTYYHEASGKVFAIDAPEVVKFKNQKEKAPKESNAINPGGNDVPDPEEDEDKDKPLD